MGVVIILTKLIKACESVRVKAARLVSVLSTFCLPFPLVVYAADAATTLEPVVVSASRSGIEADKAPQTIVII